MSDLIEKLRKYPNTIDCQDAALALEQAINLLQRAIDGDPNWNDQWPSKWRVDALQFLNTWTKNEEEE